MLDQASPPLQDEQDIGSLLEEIVSFMRRFVVMMPEQADAIALWIVHTHAIAAADWTPYVFITSAEKESGKTRLREVCSLLVVNPVPTENISKAAMFRLADRVPKPTFLFDEVDNIFSIKNPQEELTGLFNAGCYRGGRVIRVEENGKKREPMSFEVFCPKLLAGTRRAKLSDTLRSRCIFIELKRKTRDEQIERFRKRYVQTQADSLRDRLEQWADENIYALSDAEPNLPDELSDRQQDVWEPLLAIADLADGGWSKRARRAAIVLSGQAVEDDESIGVQLLGGIREVFLSRDTDRISTETLRHALGEDPVQPWASWHGGSLISARAIATLLKPFGIKPRTIRIDDETPKGYLREQFEDAWSRYLVERLSATTATTFSPTGVAADSLSDTSATRGGSENGSKPDAEPDVADVADNRAYMEGYSPTTGFTQHPELSPYLRKNKKKGSDEVSPFLRKR